MLPEDRKAPKLSSLKRSNAALKRAVAHQEKILFAMAERKELITKLQDLIDFNAGRIHGSPEEFSPKFAAQKRLKDAKDEAEKPWRSYG